MYSTRPVAIALALGLMAAGPAGAQDAGIVAPAAAAAPMGAPVFTMGAAGAGGASGSGVVSGSGNLRTDSGQFGIDLGPLYPGADGRRRVSESPRDLRGPTPSHIRIRGEGIGVPSCFSESRDGVTCASSR